MGVARLLVGVATISDSDMLDACLSSLRAQDDLDMADVYVVCNSGRVLEACRRWDEETLISVTYPGTNLGTCASWNAFIGAASAGGYDGAFILGDDIVLLDSDTYRKICEAVASEPRAFWEVKGLGFGGFVITSTLAREVGVFDDGLWPAYFEDNDYHRRVNLLGISTNSIFSKYEHVGSGSLRRWPEWEWWNAAWAFVTNSQWFMEKWGGPPGREVYREPWDGHPERAWSVKERLRQNEMAWSTRPGWDY